MIDPLDRPDPRLQRYLVALPAVRPPSVLEQRVLSAHRRQRRVRRLERLAALLLLGLLLPALLPPGLLRPAIDPPSTLAVADPVQLRAEIRALDRQLQALYAGGGEALQRDALWTARQAVALQLNQPGRSDTPAVVPVRL